MEKGKGRGFKSMSPERRAEISRKGGLSTQKNGSGYRFNSETAKAAGKKARGAKKSRIGKFEAVPSDVFRKMMEKVTFEQLSSTVAAMASEILPNVQGVYLLVLHEGADGKAATTSKMMTETRGDGWPIVSAIIEGMESDIEECDQRAKSEGLTRVISAPNMMPQPNNHMPQPNVSVGGEVTPPFGGLKLVRNQEEK